MKREIPNSIKLSVLLIFINLALILNYLRKPYYVVLGIFFLEDIPATFLVLAMLAILFLIGFFILRRNRSVYLLGLVFSVSVTLNSIINLGTILIFYADIQGFLQRIFGGDVLLGFVLIQVLLAVVNFMLYLSIRSSKRVLD